MAVPFKEQPFREYSGGVLVFEQSEATRAFFERWYDYYWEFRDDLGIRRNQPSLSAALLDSELDVFLLQSDYNASVTRIGALNDDAKILHGRPQSKLPGLAKRINRTDGNRVYFVRPGLLSEYKVTVYEPTGDTLFTKFLVSVSKRGLYETLQISKNVIIETVRRQW